MGNLMDTHFAVCCHMLCNLHIESCSMSRQRRELQNFYQRSYTVNLSDLYNAMKKMLVKMSRDRQF